MKAEIYKEDLWYSYSISMLGSILLVIIMIRYTLQKRKLVILLMHANSLMYISFPELLLFKLLSYLYFISSRTANRQTLSHIIGTSCLPFFSCSHFWTIRCVVSSNWGVHKMQHQHCLKLAPRHFVSSWSMWQELLTAWLAWLLWLIGGWLTPSHVWGKIKTICGCCLYTGCVWIFCLLARVERRECA